MKKFIKIVLAGLLFICLLEMPYGYYQFVRVAATVAFGILAINSYQTQSNGHAIVYVFLVVLFQPIEKIALGRELWNVVDVVIGLGLLLTIWIRRDD